MRKKLLWASDSTYLPTGYANQTRYILNTLSQIYDGYLFSHQYPGQEEMRDNYVHIPGGHSAYGKDQIDYYIGKYKPDMTAWLCDAFMINWLHENGSLGGAGKRKSWQEKYPNMKTLFYFPFDSEDVYPGAKEVMETFDYRVAMSRFGQKLLKKETGLDSWYIPHCTDTGIFYPLSQQEKDNIKKNSGLEGKYVVGMVGRNQSRKNPQRLLYAFAEFAKDKPEAVLLLHCDPLDPQAAGSMPWIAQKLGIAEKVLFTGVTWYSGIPQANLAQVYNAMDVHTMSTTGEGFGITTIEAMACGIPNVITDYTSTQELLVEDGKCGIPVPYSDFINGGYATKRVLPDINKMVDALQFCYDNRDEARRMGEVGRAKVLRNYSLQNVMPQWVLLMKNILQLGI